ncbi:hypothetical protein [Crocosphaera sp.]|uniref:hypothetical protein n=1 Tax=Crocosphaera sp. TaxID=2729996 RepID=UPI0026090562|nr:hypothetical protein [Crocosphaera sp.]MDJ0579246.1 hypothetical protein [Crocosphaera sp.]
MEPNDYLELIKLYQEQIKEIKLTIHSKDETIESLKDHINTLKEDKQENESLKKLIVNLKSIISDLEMIIEDRENKLIQVYNQYNIKSPGGNMSNINQTSLGSGDNTNNQLDNVTIGESYTGRDVINNESSSNLEEIVNKINRLIEQNSQTNPNNNTSDRLKIASIVIEQIETNPTWKQKAIKACKQGLLEAMKSNTIGAFVAGAIEGWKEQ